MKATIIRTADQCIINGVDNHNGEDELIILSAFSGKIYKSEKTARKALEKKGFEYIDRNELKFVSNKYLGE